MQANKKDWRLTLPAVGLEAGASKKATITINRPMLFVWDEITKPGYLNHTHPFCAKSEVIQWPGEGARDTITYFSGLHFERHFVDWVEGVGYDLELGVPPHTSARVLWRLAPVRDDASLLSIEVIPLLKADWPAARKRAHLDAHFGEHLQHYLECVVKGCEYWCRTGEAVRENQFGRNPIYSAA